MSALTTATGIEFTECMAFPFSGNESSSNPGELLFARMTFE